MPTDIDAMVAVWLSASRQSHDFIPFEYWSTRASDMRGRYLPGSDSYVQVAGGAIVGFVSLVGDDVAALFVDPASQGQGLGAGLLEFVKSLRRKLSLAVYLENQRALGFYRRHGFNVVEERVDAGTGRREAVMAWSRAADRPAQPSPTVLFDLGGVLVENVTMEALDALLGQRLAREALRDRWLSSDSVRTFELGRSSPEAFAEGFLAEWGVDLSPEEFLAEFVTWPRDFYPGSLDLVAEMRADYRVACLTNCNELHWAVFGGFANRFDEAFSSHLLGCIKPDAEVFETVLARLAAEPADVLYLDDSPVCVDAARALGIRAYRVEGPSECRRVLEAVLGTR